MKRTRFLTAAITTAAAGAAGLAGAAAAWADDADPSMQQLGQQGQLVDGSTVQAWTVTGLQPSADAIPYRPGGALWEATATDQAIAGGAIPFIPGFSARAAGGDDYRALFQVPTALGVNPSGLAQGQSTTGKLYFDVTGDAPNSVVFGQGGADRLTWVTPPPGAGGGPASNPAGVPAWSGAGYGGASASAVPQTGLGTAVAAPATASPSIPGQGGAATTPAKPAAVAAADDVHGAATAAQPKSTAAPLDVHDTTAPATSSAQVPSAQATATATAPAAAPAPAPAASAPAPAPAASAPAPAASAPAPAAASAAPVPTVIPTKAPAPTS